MSQDSHRCAICAAEFESTKDLVRHEKAGHTPQGISGAGPSNQDDRASDKPREGREFTRRSFE
jgi:hypothetical protein